MASAGVATAAPSPARRRVSASAGGAHPYAAPALSPDPASESLGLQIQRNMRTSACVVCCITPKYLQSSNCLQDLSLAESLGKPIIPAMLRFYPWPPEGAPVNVRKILVKYSPVDLSSEKLFRQNILSLVDLIRKCNGRVGLQGTF